MKSRAFSLKRGNVRDYCNIAVLFNKQGTGILQKHLPLEAEVMRRGEEALKEFRENPLDADEMEVYYDWVDAFVREKFRVLFEEE